MLKGPPNTMVMFEQGFAGLIKELWILKIEQAIQASCAKSSNTKEEDTFAEMLLDSVLFVYFSLLIE